MLGWVAAVSATESPSQPSPPFIHRMWTTGSAAEPADEASLVCVSVAMPGHLLTGKWRIADWLHPGADAIMLNPGSGRDKTEPSIRWTQMSWGRVRPEGDGR
jgi:hypothetical protein